MSLQKNEDDDLDISEQNDIQQGSEAQSHLPPGQDFTAASFAHAASSNLNGIGRGLSAFPGVAQGATGNLNHSQLLEEQQRRLMLIDQAQTNQRNMLIRQNAEYGQFGRGQLSAGAGNPQYLNHQMLLNQSNARPMMMDPLLSTAGSAPQMGTAMNPEMLFGRQANSLPPGFLPQHAAAVANFQSGGMTPTMQQQHLAAMNQMSNLINFSSFDRGMLGQHDMAAMHEVNAAAAAAAGRIPDAQFNKNDDKKDAPTKAMPIRPLSAYNFFFRDERERILKDDDGKEEESLSPESLEKKKKRLLDQHLLKDRTRRRPHRKTHGKIGFTTLSKLIGKRWRELPDDKKEFYKEIASMDMARYQEDVAEYNKDRLFHKSPN